MSLRAVVTFECVMRILFTFCAVKDLCGYEGPNAEEELEGAKNAIQVLGCELEEVKHLHYQMKVKSCFNHKT